MTFRFNLGKQYKIWFSAQRDEFLPMMNQLRLIRMRHNNPKIQISLVYSQRCLNQKALDELKAFCDKYNIMPVEFDEIAARLTHTKDKALAYLVNHELNGFLQQAGGNLAAASDCARLIRALIEAYGVYADFDVDTKLEQLFSNLAHFFVSLQGPVLLYGLMAPYEGSNSLKLFANNDFLGFSLDETGTQLSAEAIRSLDSVQSEVIRRYQECFSQESFIALQNRDVQELFGQIIDSKKRSLFELRMHLQESYSNEQNPHKKTQFLLCFKLTVCSISGPELYPYLFAHLLPENLIQHFPMIPATQTEYKEMFLRSSVAYYDLIYDAMSSGNDPYFAMQSLSQKNKKSGGDLSWIPGQHNRLEKHELALHKISNNVAQFWKGGPRTQALALGAKRIREIPALFGAFHNKQYGLTLRKAVVGGEMAVIQYLLNGLRMNVFSFDINEASSNGNTALDWALNSSNHSTMSMVRILKAAGALTHKEIEAQQVTATLKTHLVR